MGQGRAVLGKSRFRKTLKHACLISAGKYHKTVVTKQTLKSDRPGKVLVLGQDSRSCLSVVRSLGRKNLIVHLAWTSPESLVRHSKYVQQVHEIPVYQADDDAWREALIRLLRTQKYDLVIPCSDPTILPLQYHRSDFETFTPLALLRDEVFEIVFDKTRLNTLAASLGINLPKSETINTLAQVRGLSSKLGLPLVLKPASSFRMSNLRRKNHVRIADSEEEAAQYVANMLPEGAVQAQACFKGIGVGVEVLADEGRILLAFQHERVHEPIGGGGSSYRKSAPLQSELFEATKILMRALRYTGVGMVEFMYNTQTGRWIFVEINGRFWGSLPLAIASGVDFPYALYQLLVEKKTRFDPHYRHPIFCRNTSKDFQWLLDQLRAAPAQRQHKNLPLLAYFMEGLNILKLRERNDTLVWDDAKPGFLELKQLIGDTLSRMVSKLRLRYLARPFWRKRHALKARRAVRNANVLLFVCKGNICRSPFAAHYAKTLCPQTLQVRSCGYFPVKGRKSPEDAQQTARDFGIDLRDHRSTILSEALLREADLIFVFDEENRNTLAIRFPFCKSKLYFLGALFPQKGIIIQDPYNQGPATFTLIYKSIALALETLFQKARHGN